MAAASRLPIGRPTRSAGSNSDKYISPPPDWLPPPAEPWQQRGGRAGVRRPLAGGAAEGGWAVVPSVLFEPRWSGICAVAGRV